MKKPFLKILVVTIIAFAIIMSAGSLAFSDCGSFAFPTQEKLLRYISRTLAKIYSNPERGCYAGTATVIDLEKGLLLTASHVAQHNVLYVSFPYLEHNNFYRATVIHRVDQVDGELEASGGSWHSARDIAIIKLDTPVLAVEAAEVWLDYFDLNKELYFFSFSGNSATSVPGKAMANVPISDYDGKPAKCTYELREATENGDSGSPVFDGAGLIVGLIIQSKNENRAGRFIPTRCFSSVLNEPFKEHLAKETLTIIGQKSIGELKTMLKPPIKKQSWISNLKLASAIEIAANDEKEAKRLESKHKCPIRYAIIERGLGYDLYDRYCCKLLSQTADELKKDAEMFEKTGLKYEHDGQTNVALAFYGASELCYKKHTEKKYKISGNYDTFLPTNKTDSFQLLDYSKSVSSIAALQNRRSILAGDYYLGQEAIKNELASFSIKKKEHVKNQVDEIVKAIDGGKTATDFADAASKHYYVYILDKDGKLLVHPAVLEGKSPEEASATAVEAATKATVDGNWVKYTWKDQEKNAYVRATKTGEIVGSGY